MAWRIRSLWRPATYTLTEVNNTTDGPNGLPSVTSILSIQGAGADTTVIERDTSAPGFRLVHVAATGTLTLEGLTLRGGGGFRVPGGGLLNQGGTIALAHVLVTGNEGVEGGGLRNEGGTVTIAQAMFVGNFGGVPGNGGGISNPSGTVTITETTFTGNGAGNGGAIGNGGSMVILNSTIADNGAFETSGGLFNFSSGTSGGTAILINTTIARNLANIGGPGVGPGGVLNLGTVIFNNCTVAENISNSEPGGGLATFGKGPVSLLMNTILARNSGTRGVPDCFGPVTSLGHNLIADPTGCGITLQPTDLTGDPGLGDFTDNGTPGNGHFPLQPGSPAIDAGNDTFCPLTDQLGQPRVGRCDIGAIEFQGKHHK
jgi:hypothetical protein